MNSCYLCARSRLKPGLGDLLLLRRLEEKEACAKFFRARPPAHFVVIVRRSNIRTFGQLQLALERVERATKQGTARVQRAWQGLALLCDPPDLTQLSCGYVLCMWCACGRQVKEKRPLRLFERLSRRVDDS